jgi:TfoX/Sxy family transcriptional regulator of competence genes
VSRQPTAGSFPRPDPGAREAFEALLPEDPRILVRPMFGNVAAFVNGNMFTGLFGQDLFVRLPEEDRAGLLEAGGAEFQPMPGRPMKEYVSVPRPWRNDLDGVRTWIGRSLAWAATLPLKQPRKRRS